MKKITLAFIAIFCLAFTWHGSAQHTFAPEGPVSVPGATEITLNINDPSNSAGVPAAIYTNFIVSVDWTDVNNAWSNEANLTIATSAGAVLIDPPTTGASSSGNATTLTFVGVLAGNYDPSVDGTLDLILDQSWGASEAQWDNITVTISEAPATPDCATTPFPADGAIDVAVGNLTFTWTAPATGPTPTAYNVYAYDDAAGTNPFFIVTVATTSADLVINAYDTEIFWAAIPVNGSTEATGCDVWSFTTQSPPPPPANDNLCNATLLSLDTSSSGGAFTIVSATTETSEIGGTCWFNNDPASNSVWFSFVAPASGEVQISTVYDDGDLADTQLTLYSLGDCNDLTTLTELACDEDDDANIDATAAVRALLQYSGLTPGQTYYIQVDGYSDGVGTFDMGLFDLSTLSVDSHITNGFSYFPNPVKNTLNLKAQNTIQNVAIYNMLGQEVLRTAPNSMESDVNMNALQSGAYFVKVTINDVTETIRVVKQ